MHDELGPLRGLVGVWEGDKGDDTAPSDDRGTENNKFRETMIFEKLTPVVNHEQVLQGLRYRTTAIRLGEKDPFHEELGYWLWDGTHKQVLRCFMIPRGVTVIAGGTAEADAKGFELKADVGSPTYGICSNQFLDKEFKTVHYILKLSWDAEILRYEEDSQIQIKGKPEIFHHIDKNVLRKVPTSF